jgi:hypothetical protein
MRWRSHEVDPDILKSHLTSHSLIDARGKRSLRVGPQPFPTLRAQIGDTEDALETVLTDAFGLDLSPGGPLAICLTAISFLMAQHPFIQRLTCSYEIAVTVCADLSKGVTEHANMPAA